MQTVKMIAKRMILDLGVVMKNYTFWLMIFLSPLLFYSIPIVFAPSQLSMQVVVVGSCSITSAIVYSQIAGVYRISSLYKNSKLNRQDKITSNISGFSVTLLISLFVLIIVLAYMEFFGIWDILLDGWIWEGANSHKDFAFSFFALESGAFALVWYSVIEITLIICALGFMMFRISDNTKNYFVIILAFVILDIILGGIFNNYFRFDNWGDGFVPSFELNLTLNMFPEYFFVPSLFFPLYPSSQHLVNCSNIVEDVQRFGKTGIDPFVWLTFSNVSPEVVNKWGDIWKWNILWILPWVWIAGFATIGILNEKK